MYQPGGACQDIWKVKADFLRVSSKMKQEERNIKQSHKPNDALYSEDMHKRPRISPLRPCLALVYSRSVPHRGANPLSAPFHTKLQASGLYLVGVSERRLSGF